MLILMYPKYPEDDSSASAVESKKLHISLPALSDAKTNIYKGFLVDMEYAAKAEDSEIKKAAMAEEAKRRTHTVSFSIFIIC